jgi:hypothetical protein
MRKAATSFPALFSSIRLLKTSFTPLPYPFSVYTTFAIFCYFLFGWCTFGVYEQFFGLYIASVLWVSPSLETRVMVTVGHRTPALNMAYPVQDVVDTFCLEIGII